MASAAEIQRRTAAAQRELTAALAALSARFGVDVVQVEGIHYRRDAAYERMLRWQALARWAQAVAQAAGDAAPVHEAGGDAVREALRELLAGLSKSKLLAFASERGIALDATRGKAELVEQVLGTWWPSDEDA